MAAPRPAKRDEYVLSAGAMEDGTFWMVVGMTKEALKTVRQGRPAQILFSGPGVVVDGIALTGIYVFAEDNLDELYRRLGVLEHEKDVRMEVDRQDNRNEVLDETIMQMQKEANKEE